MSVQHAGHVEVEARTAAEAEKECRRMLDVYFEGGVYKITQVSFCPGPIRSMADPAYWICTISATGHRRR